jgi:hypothetical protein
MSTRCFMVDRVMDCWDDNGQRVGAMVWGRHQVDEHDADPRPFPHLQVMTPAGLVCLDCPESDPPYLKWTRTGEPPNVTVAPSLNVNPGRPEGWHGWLQNGELTP